ncbi:hypothetical protein OPT61_g880 [Boeremia exigua]|uniref:Uncharacterized protein n=1 Tax=Boeremia exigua TaxID=749465 RepID=A0ACC2IS49_9PLEO|nr:hypothetical protein OPT61_g880 [Boeremia exigua]
MTKKVPAQGLGRRLQPDDVTVLSTISRGRPKAGVFSINESPLSTPSSDFEGIQRMAVHRAFFSSIRRTAMRGPCLSPNGSPTSAHNVHYVAAWRLERSEQERLSSIAYATTATCAAEVSDSMTSFSAHCSAVPQVPSYGAPRLGWRPLPDPRSDRRFCRNCRLGCACPAELDDADMKDNESTLTGQVSSHSSERSSTLPCVHKQMRLLN